MDHFENYFVMSSSHYMLVLIAYSGEMKFCFCVNLDLYSKSVKEFHKSHMKTKTNHVNDMVTQLYREYSEY